MASSEIDGVLSSWFGELDAEGRADAAHTASWFKKDPAFDQGLRERFGALHASVAAGERDGWLATSEGTLAFVIVLDQLSRNMFRGTARMFATDGRALEVATACIDAGRDASYRFHERWFLYLPLMHAEDLATQERCVSLYSGWRDGLAGDLREALGGAVKYAIAHRDVVKRFGRFPHRNEALGRASSPQEVEFLGQPGSSF